MDDDTAVKRFSPTLEVPLGWALLLELDAKPSWTACWSGCGNRTDISRGKARPSHHPNSASEPRP